MKILVAIKQTATLEAGFEVSGDEVDEKFVGYELNESDKHAIEEAIQISEGATADVEVVCVTIGPARATEIANYALAMGADRAIRVWDDGLAAIGFLEPKAKAEILAAVARAEEPDLLLTGVQSDDAMFGATGVYLARELGFAWAAAISSLDLDVDGSVATVERELEGGLEEVIEVDLPAVLTLQAGLNEPRYVSLRTVYRSAKSPREMELSELDVSGEDIATHFPVTSLERPEKSTAFIDGDLDSVSAQLADVLGERGVLP